MYIGNHLSSAKGYEAMGKQAVRLGGETFAFFTRNPRGGKAKEIKPEDVEKFLEIVRDGIKLYIPYLYLFKFISELISSEVYYIFILCFMPPVDQPEPSDRTGCPMDLTDRMNLMNSTDQTSLTDLSYLRNLSG